MSKADWTTSSKQLAFIGAIALAVSIGCGVGQASAMERRPVAALTIYPGDIIRDNMLTDMDFPNAEASSAYASVRSMLVGKVARRTLLPGQAIPTNAVGEPKIVTVGAIVRITFVDGGLTIATYASALQGGAAGDVISVRNMESGITISGVIQADGSIHVGSG